MLIELMPTRMQGLEAAYEGLQRSGTMLVSYVPEVGYGAAGMTDDPGIYVAAPWIARTVGIDVLTAANVLLIGILLAGISIGIAGLLKWYTRPLSRIISVTAMVLLGIVALGWAPYEVGDVYVASAAILTATVPWLLVLSRERTPSPALLWLAPLFGLLAGCANAMRSHAGTTALAFALALALGWMRPVRPFMWRIVFAALVASGLLLVGAGMGGLEARRDAFLTDANGGRPPVVLAHPLWHSIYIGLGYVENDYGIEYNDTIAAEKAAELAPDAAYVSPEYERALRGEVFRLASIDPGLILRNLAAKSVRLLFFLALFANVGIVAGFLARRPPGIDAAFAAALAFGALPGLLVTPEPRYVLGFITLAVLWAVTSIDAYLTKRVALTPSAS